MISFTGQLILLDIEGTTSSVSFVYDKMFPLVLRELDLFLADNAAEADVVAACDQIAVDAGHESVQLWTGQPLDHADSQATVAAEVRRLMEDDVKATGLKQLQGVIWKSAFESGQLKAHVYDDVPPALKRWHHAGLSLRIYSSGSVQAQKLFFGHTIAATCCRCFRATTTQKPAANARLQATRKLPTKRASSREQCCSSATFSKNSMLPQQRDCKRGSSSGRATNR